MMRRTAYGLVQVAAMDGSSMDDLRRIASKSDGISRFEDMLGDRKALRRALGEAAEKHDLVGRAEKDFFYLVARSLTSTRDDRNQNPIPNGNNDCFVQSELLRTDRESGMPHYRSFVGRGLFTNHQSDQVEKCFGNQLDVRFAYGAEPVGWADTSLHNLLAIDKRKAQDLGIMDGIRSGYLNTWSMGCDIEAAVCSVCGNKVVTDMDPRCAHVQPGNKGREMISEASGFPWNGRKVVACDILVAPRFVELSAVTVPADHTAETVQTIGEIDDMGRTAAYEVPAYEKVEPTRDTVQRYSILPDGRGAFTVRVTSEVEARFADYESAEKYVESLEHERRQSRSAADDGEIEREVPWTETESEAQREDSSSPRSASPRRRTLFEPASFASTFRELADDAIARRSG